MELKRQIQPQAGRVCDSSIFGKSKEELITSIDLLIKIHLCFSWWDFKKIPAKIQHLFCWILVGTSTELPFVFEAI